MSDDPPTCTSLPIPVGKSSGGGVDGDEGNANTTASIADDDPDGNQPAPRTATENGSSSAAALGTKDVRRASPSGSQRQGGHTNQQSGRGGGGDQKDPLTSYFIEAMSTLYATTVDAPCQRVHELEHSIQESFLNCQQFDFLHFLKTEEGHVDESVYGRNAPIGPPHCEYCGASSTEMCGPGCERPRLFFRNKIPPFGRKEEWDGRTEYRLRDTAGGEDPAAGASVDQRGGNTIAADQEDDDDVLTSFNSLAADGHPDREAQLKAEEDAWCDGGCRRTFSC